LRWCPSDVWCGNTVVAEIDHALTSKVSHNHMYSDGVR
jgi:hypothetical protein